MRTQQLALAAALAAAVFSATAAPARLEPVNSPFTYEALGATPSLTFGRAAARKADEAPKAAEATKATEAPKAAAAAAVASQPADASKAAAAPAPKTSAPARAAGSTVSPFTWDALGATPHVELKKQPAKSEVQAPGAAH